MDRVVTFVPRSDLTAQENLDGFVDVARNKLQIFGADLSFDENRWSLDIELTGRRAGVFAVFSEWDTAGRRAGWVPMPEPFLGFAKAYFRYQHAMRPTNSFNQRLAVLRALCRALSENDLANVIYVDESILNCATQLLKEGFEKHGAYRAAQQLEMLANFLDENCLATVPLHWNHSVRRPEGVDRVGAEFEERRNEKLPSPAGLNAIAQIYRLADDPSTKFVTSLCAVMLCAPDRIGEITSLRADCEHRDTDSDKKPVYGLRYWPEKGADPQIKWVLPSMVSLCEEALSKVRTLTEEARNIARWYEERWPKGEPKQLYLPPELEHFRGNSELTMRQVSQMVFVGADSRITGRLWCESNGIKLSKKGRSFVASFAEIETVLLSMLPSGFPILSDELGLTFSEALCVLPLNFFHSTRSNYRSVIMAVSSDDLNARLGGRSDTGIKSIFQAYEFYEDDGSDIKINTHQFRHYLNTLAQTGGVSELDIAKWSGRKDLGQNRAYDQESGRDLLKRMNDTLGDVAIFSASAAFVPTNDLILRSESASLLLEAAHTTDFGYCIHNFTFSPCQIHRDCINCDEQVCVKGEAAKEANIRQLRNESISLVAAAEAAVRAGVLGADTWLEHQQQTLSRAEELLAMIDNPAIEPGAIIRLTQLRPASRLRQAQARRVENGIDSAMEQLPRSMGGNS